MVKNKQPGRSPGTRKSAGRVNISERYARILDGTFDVSELSWEELTQGRLADKDGHFRGRPPLVIPTKFHQALAREMQTRLNKKFQAYAEEAVDTLVEIMREGEGAEETEFDYAGRPTSKTKGGTKRIDAAKYIVERVMGKIADKSEVDVNMTVWQGMVESGELVVDVEVDNVPPEEPQKALPRKRGPRTRPRRDEDGPVT